MKMMIAAFLAVVASLFLASYASALSSSEAGSVVEVLERLVEEHGEPVYYDEEAADEWFELDTEALIPAAGFSRESWRKAYGNSLKGLMASVPEAEFEAVFAGLEDNVTSIQGLTAEQKREAVSDLRAHVDRARALRAEGASHVDALAPYAERLRALTDF
ncbi:hypothetical protein [Neoaquamicrobium microcysteis]|nr:hypothetical protein [Mesorhizobium microcysteis]